jgi:hypothetical protein
MKWEYKIIETGKTKGLLFQSKKLDCDELNRLGQEGWELVSAFSVGGSAPGYGTKASPDQVFLIFKRQLI